MPTRKLKDVQYQSMAELNGSWEVKALNINQLSYLSLKRCLESADSLFKTASKNYDQGDEEVAYTLYMRFLQLMTVLPKLKDYDKKYASAMLAKKPAEATSRAEELSASLERRYEINREAVERLEAISEQTVTTKSTEAANGGIKVPVAKVEKLNILPTELFEWIKSGEKSFLIVDIRRADDYEQATFSTPHVINLPLEKIRPGLTALGIEGFLRGDSRKLFKLRHSYDYIVLSDYQSELSDLAQKSSIQVVSDALFVYDTVGILKNRPILLTGGFKSWVMYYPTHCTNISENIRPVVPQPKREDITHIVIEYPSLIPKAPDKVVQPPSVPQATVDVPLPEEVPPVAYPSLPHEDLLDRLSKVRVIPKETNGRSEHDAATPSPLELAKSVREDISRPSVPSRKLKPVEGGAARQDPKKVLPPSDDEDEGEYVGVKLPQPQEDAEKAQMLAEIERLRNENTAKDEDLQRKEEDIERRRELDRLRKQRKTEEKLHKVVVDPSTSVMPDAPEVSTPTDTDAPVTLTPQAPHHVPTIPPKPPAMVVPRPDPEPAKVKPVPKPSVTTVVSDKVTLQTPSSSVNMGEFSGMKRSISSPNVAKLIDEETGSKPASRREKGERGLPPKTPSVATPSTRLSESAREGFMKFLMERKSVIQSQAIDGCKGRYITGLRNLGNTCFMNSILQCLSNTPQLSTFFCSNAFLVHLNPHNKMGSSGHMAVEFAAVIGALASGQYRYFSPSTFRQAVSRYKPDFAGCDQQDSQEFLNFLLDALHEDLNGADKAKVKEQDNDRLSDAEAAFRSWQSHLIHNSSILVNLFQGQYKSTLECHACGHQSRTFETFMFLSLPVPKRQSCRLGDCLQAYMQPEVMSGDSQYHCPKCKSYQDAKKTIQLWKLPEVLLIHFKRFQWQGQWRSKINTIVDYPTSGLDMSPFVIGVKPKAHYDLYAVSHHTGTLEGGHYTAVCRNPENSRWYFYDDQDVSEINNSSSKLRGNGAYILCYASR